MEDSANSTVMTEKEDTICQPPTKKLRPEEVVETVDESQSFTQEISIQDKTLVLEYNGNSIYLDTFDEDIQKNSDRQTLCSDNDDTDTYWQNDLGTLLLSLYKSYFVDKKISEEVLKKNRIYETITEELKKAGFNLSLIQVKSKLNTLKNHYEEIIHSKKKNENNSTCQSAENNANPKRVATWSEVAGSNLISLYKQYYPKVGTLGMKNKRQLWEKISKKLKNLGYNYSPLQVENKFKGLKRRTQEAVERNLKYGYNKYSCPFQKELEDIMEQTKFINEPNTLYAESSFEINQDDPCDKWSSSENEDTVSDVLHFPIIEEVEVPPNKKMKFQENKNDVAYELKMLRTERKDAHRENLEMKKQWLKAYKERTDVIRRRNNFLDILVDRKEKVNYF